MAFKEGEYDTLAFLKFRSDFFIILLPGEGVAHDTDVFGTRIDTVATTEH